MPGHRITTHRYLSWIPAALLALAVGAPAAAQPAPETRPKAEAPRAKARPAAARPAPARRAAPAKAVRKPPRRRAAPRAIQPPPKPKKKAEDPLRVPGWTLNNPDSWFQFRPTFELGFLAPLSHIIKFGSDGTRFNYIKDGGQDNLFLFWRIQFQLWFKKRHRVTLLYQPLNIRTRVTLQRDVRVNELDFPAGTPLDLRYGFDFYRVSYHYQAVNLRGFTFSVGGGIQLRNATIDFTSVDGLLNRSNRDIGPVPLIKIVTGYQVNRRFWMELEVDTIWAGDKIINGSTNKIEGWIIDMSLRLGFNFTSWGYAFLNTRLIAGGAIGISEDDTGPGDGYTNNQIKVLIFSLGIGLR